MEHEEGTETRFGFRSRSVSRAGSNGSLSSNHSSNSTNNNNNNHHTINSSLVKKSVDNYNKNTLLVTNINKQTSANVGKVSSNLVKYRSSSEQSRGSNLNRIPTSSIPTTAPERNINRSGIPSPRPLSTSGIPSLPRPTSNSTLGGVSNLPPRGYSRPTSWAAYPHNGNKAAYTDKTEKQVYNTRVQRAGTQSPAPRGQSASRIQPPSITKPSVGSKLPAPTSRLPRSGRKLEMVQKSRNRFELEEVVPIKSEKKPVAAPGTVVATLIGYGNKASPSQRRSLRPASVRRSPTRPLSSLLSSSSDESDNSEHEPSPTEDPNKTLCPDNVLNGGGDAYDAAGEDDLVEMDGPGETMAMMDEEEGPVLKQDDVSPDQSLDVNPNLRSVLLNIEDPAFAVLAAMSSNDRLEDVNAPDSPSTSESTEMASPLKKAAAPPAQSTFPMEQHSTQHPTPELDSPGTPTNVSFSDGEGEGGCLIDDEISDQPGLVFDEDQTMNQPAQHHNQPREHSTIARESRHMESSPARSRGTLSPCSSITSEDLMLDFDLSEADCPQRSTSGRKSSSNTKYTLNNNNYCSEKIGESTYVGKEDIDEDDNVSVSTDSGYSFIGHLEEDVASIKTELVTLRNILSLERDSFSERESDLKRQIMLLKQECMEQVRVATLLREELAVYKSKEQKRHKLVMKSNVSTQTERSRPSSLGYVSEGSDGSTRSLISSDEQLMSSSVS
ncbi:hypothetical protein WDU94_011351 [Cyamophila willieti]